MGDRKNAGYSSYPHPFYFDVPMRFRPSTLNLLWHDVTGQYRRHDPEKVQYEVFDFDGF